MDIQHFQRFTTIDVGRISGGLSCGMMECRGERFRFVLQRHFYFGFVIHGTASLADMKRNYAIEEADIFVLTPSMTACIEATDENCRISCIRMSPDFFDTLCDGQPTYNQLARFFSEARIPTARLEAAQCEYLKKTVALFSGQLDAFALNQEGIIRHLCSFYLLQVANALYQESGKKSECVARPNEIYRRFKQLAVENYRKRHGISFYACRLHITPTYLSRTVKAVTGRTVHSIISELVYADAVKHLECTDMDIKEIAEILGFADQSSFGKFFLKRAGTPPSKFRTRKRQA